MVRLFCIIIFCANVIIIGCMCHFVIVLMQYGINNIICIVRILLDLDFCSCNISVVCLNDFYIF